MKVNLLTTLLILLPWVSFSQRSVKRYQKIKKIITETSTASQINDSLHTFQMIRFPYNRRLHKKYRHLRAFIDDEFQIDALSYKNQVILRSLRLIRDSTSGFYQIDTLAVNKFLFDWNSFYKADKTIGDLTREIVLFEGFALKAAFGQPTQYLKQLKTWVAQEKVDTFKVLLQSFYVERQTFGSIGIRHLRKKGVKLPKKLRQLARHIRRRNSKILTNENSCVVEVRPFF